MVEPSSLRGPCHTSTSYGEELWGGVGVSAEGGGSREPQLLPLPLPLCLLSEP